MYKWKAHTVGLTRKTKREQKALETKVKKQKQLLEVAMTNENASNSKRATGSEQFQKSKKPRYNEQNVPTVVRTYSLRSGVIDLT